MNTFLEHSNEPAYAVLVECLVYRDIESFAMVSRQARGSLLGREALFQRGKFCIQGRPSGSFWISSAWATVFACAPALQLSLDYEGPRCTLHDDRRLQPQPATYIHDNAAMVRDMRSIFPMLRHLELGFRFHFKFRFGVVGPHLPTDLAIDATSLAPLLEGVASLTVVHVAVNNVPSWASVASLVELTLRGVPTRGKPRGPRPLRERLAELASLQQLRRLTLDCMDIECVAFAAQMPRLEQLRVTRNGHWLVCAWSIEQLDACTSLTVLDLQGTRLVCPHWTWTKTCHTLRDVTPQQLPVAPSIVQFRITGDTWPFSCPIVWIRVWSRLSNVVIFSCARRHVLGRRWRDADFKWVALGAIHKYFPSACWSTLRSLDLDDLEFDDISMLGACVHLKLLRVNLSASAAASNQGTTLRSLCSLTALGGRRLVLNEFVDALPRLQQLELWLDSESLPWSAQARAYVVSSTAPIQRLPPVEIVALRRLLVLELRLSDKSGYQLDECWFALITRECVRLVTLSVLILGSQRVSRRLQSSSRASVVDLSALRRLERLIVPRFVLGSTADAFVPLYTLLELDLGHWPHTDMTLLCTVGLPRLRCLRLDSRIPCDSIKRCRSHKFPALVEIWHPAFNCFASHQTMYHHRCEGFECSE